MFGWSVLLVPQNSYLKTKISVFKIPYDIYDLTIYFVPHLIPDP